MKSTDYILAGCGLETPLINAAGSINGTNPELILREVEILASTAIGAITVGSFTVPPQEGNEAAYGAPVYYYDRETGATYNSMGLPNIGLQAAKKLMPEIVARARGKPVIASVSPVRSSAEVGDTYNQTIRLVYDMLLAGANLVEVNTSCPNIIEDDERKPILGYDLRGMEKLVAELAPWTGTRGSQVGVKLPPYISEDELAITPRLAEILLNKRVFSFVTTANTIPDKVPLDEHGEPILSVPKGRGGMSGPAAKQEGRRQLDIWHSLLNDEIEIVSTLGVDDGDELAYRCRHGASAAGGVTFLWQENNWGQAVTNMVTQWSDAQ